MSLKHNSKIYYLKPKAMKTKAYLTIASIILVAFAAVFWVQSCSKSVDPLVITNPTTKLFLKGKVIDKATKLGIANAIVTIGGITEITTNSEGIYMKEIDITTYNEVKISAKALGYGLGSTEARINNGQITVNTITLKKLNTPITIGPDGGKIESTNNEGFLNNKIELTIPPNAFSYNVDISVTPYEGIEVPGFAPVDFLNLVTVNLAPQGLTSNLPIKLSFPLPFISKVFDSLPIFYFNETFNTWEVSDRYAKIDTEINMASTDINRLGTYSLGIPGTYRETIEEYSESGSSLLDPDQSSTEVGWLAKVEYPEGIPDSVSPVWLKNVVSQNTYLGGGRVSFFDSTYTTINYLGSKPDSIVNNKSSKGCLIWEWVPQLCRRKIKIPEWVRVKIITPDGCFYIWVIPNWVWKYEYYDCGYWKCTHDQGGGK
ncbi:MAG: hypothetical protein CVU06_07575 [Bacteroidetes bacterium HGW-Bacteroidetes-22]|nr:MAG: hypothetical protein CVU06_07575 [Bacteroidetes bacterium HGW-Bacteroidetes-22]